MKRVGVLSDTHFSSFHEGYDFLRRLSEGPFRDVDIIFHAGDIVQPDILLAFSDRRVYAVRGNMDPPAPDLPQRRIVGIDGFRFGLIHGWGSPNGMVPKLMQEFSGSVIDCLVFGHSHAPMNQVDQGILLFNPGSPTLRRGAPFHSVGLLEIGTSLRGRIISLDA